MFSVYKQSLYQSLLRVRVPDVQIVPDRTWLAYSTMKYRTYPPASRALLQYSSVLYLLYESLESLDTPTVPYSRIPNLYESLTSTVEASLLGDGLASQRFRPRRRLVVLARML